MRYILSFILIVLLASCQEVVRTVAEEIKETIDNNDSTAEAQEAEEDGNAFVFNVSKEYKILERKKAANDSLYLVRRFYTDGKKYADSWYKNNLRDGLTIMYHKDGSVFFKLIFQNDTEYTALQGIDIKGKKLDCGNLKNGTGKLLFYYATNDAKFYELSYQDKKKNGDFVAYYSNGGLFKKGSFKNDQAEGQFITYYKNGHIKEKGLFHDGIPEGSYTSYFHSGSIQKIEAWKNKKPDYAIEYDLKGYKVKEQLYKPNDSSQIEIRYVYGSKGDLTSKCEYKNVFKYGKYEYYENAKIKSVEQWRNDTLVREKTWYTTTGNLKSQSVYKNNDLDSIYTEYYSDGKLRLQQTYKNGGKNGPYISYYANGKKYVVGTYVNDEPLGKFQYYTKEGVYKGTNEFKAKK